MAPSEKLLIKWDNISNSPCFRDIWDNKEMMDVSLSCGEEEVAAHRVVLAACSPKLGSVLTKHAQRHHPIIYLAGMKLSHIKNILHFMYHGEVLVPTEELNSFLKVAEELQVKGLNGAGQGESPGKDEAASSTAANTSIASSSRTTTEVSTTLKTESVDSNSNCDQSGSASDTLNLNKSFTEKADTWGIIKMADFPVVDGSRHHFWKESFVKNLLLAVKNEEIDMKGAAELLGVTYASLYGRYRESWGYLRKSNKQSTKPDLVILQPEEKSSGPGENTAEEEGNYEDTLMEVQSELVVNNAEDLEEHIVCEEEVVEKVHSHYGSNIS